MPTKHEESTLKPRNDQACKAAWQDCILNARRAISQKLLLKAVSYRVGLPEREFCPRIPKPQVTPCPAATPRPFLVLDFCDPGAGDKFPRNPYSPSVKTPTEGSAARASRRFQSKTFMESEERPLCARVRGAACELSPNLLADETPRDRIACCPASGAMNAEHAASDDTATTAMAVNLPLASISRVSDESSHCVGVVCQRVDATERDDRLSCCLWQEHWWGGVRHVTC